MLCNSCVDGMIFPVNISYPWRIMLIFSSGGSLFKTGASVKGKMHPTARGKSIRFTAETQRTLRKCSYDPIRRRRLDPGLSSFGNRYRCCFIAIGLQKRNVLIQKRAFLFGGLSPSNKKIISLRTLRLCGEISILDKNKKFHQGDYLGQFVIQWFYDGNFFSVTYV